MGVDEPDSALQSGDSVVYLRNPEASVVVRSDCLIHIGTNGHPQVWKEGGDILWRTLKVLREPKCFHDVAVETGIPSESLREIIRVLLAEKLIVAVDPLRSESVNNDEPLCDTLVLGISGTIQAASMINLMLELRVGFAKTVHVVLTKAALKFLPSRVVKYYGFTVWTDMFEPRGEVNVPHIHLASAANLVAVIPASAHTIHRLATGECSDLLSLIVAATKAPVVVAPAMNPAMLRCPAIDRNVTQLQEDGIYVVEPGFAWEVSEREISSRSVGGIGVKAHNIVPVLQSILLAGKRLSESQIPVPVSDT